MAKTVEAPPLVDCSQLETRKSKKDFEIKCPCCGEWVPVILHTDRGAMCKDCWQKEGKADD